MTSADDRYKLFEIFRDLRYQSAYNRSISVPDTLSLNSIKIIGPRFQEPTVFAQEDATFIISALAYIENNDIPFNTEFSGDFDTLEKNKYFKTSDFLKSAGQADILFVHNIIRPPKNDEKDKGYDTYQQSGGLSNIHHLKGAWVNAASNHQTKLIFTFGGDNEVSAKDFLGGNFVEVEGRSQPEHMNVLIEKDYFEKIKECIPLSITPSAASTPSHHPEHKPALL